MGDGDSRRRLSCDSAAGVAARCRLDEDVEDPADSPFPRVSFLLTPLILVSSLGRYVFGSEISYNKAPPRLPGLAC